MNDIKPGVPVLGIITKTLEEVTPNKGATHQRITVQCYDLGFVSVRIYGKINEVMEKHLRIEGAGILVNATEVSPWVPEDKETKEPKRYTKEGTFRTGKVCINFSAVANNFRLHFLPKVTAEGGTANTNTSATANTGDTVRGGDDSQPVSANTNAGGGGNTNATKNPWDGYEV